MLRRRCTDLYRPFFLKQRQLENRNERLNYSVCLSFYLQEAKKKYDKETEKYCSVLEKHLSLSAKKKESHLHDVRRRFCSLT